MRLWLAITRLLSIIAIVSVVLAPFTAPAGAGGMAKEMPGAASDNTSNDGATATVDMPCCPPAKPADADCRKACPLATLCFAKLIQGVLPVSAVRARIDLAMAFLPVDDATPETQAPSPPPRPPQA
ncbi:hypothetical protein SLNSH_06630 [Alsobacter soli]|uniref:DUF2946 domain-containing protein n=1 Tax=Alsobacter soli TaxID=2109933 RepID=A0A2T1HVF7_9HYPH|nr:hypothetical protein [Alsobacter soli]PSC05653.1 hypothetical protein SLNSH_06630 [Alsobacter soli]